MFRLIATLKQGVGTDIDELGLPYATLDDARRAAREVARHDVVSHVMIVQDGIPPAFVEWAVY